MIVPFTPPPGVPGRDYSTPTPPPPPGYRLTPAQPLTRVSQLPQRPAPRRKRFWLCMLAFIFLCLLFEPIRILGVMLLFFWILAIGVIPHVAVLKVMTGGHRR